MVCFLQVVNCISILFHLVMVAMTPPSSSKLQRNQIAPLSHPTTLTSPREVCFVHIVCFQCLLSLIDCFFAICVFVCFHCLFDFYVFLLFCCKGVRAGYTAWDLEPWTSAEEVQTGQLIRHLTNIFHSPSWNEGDPLLFIFKGLQTGSDVLSPHRFRATGGYRPFLRVDYVVLKQNIPGHEAVHAIAKLINTQEGLAVIIVLFAYAILTFIFASFSYSMRKKLEGAKKRRTTKMLFKQPSHLAIFGANAFTGSHPLSEWELPPSALLINKRIASGRFGHIYEATARDLKEFGTVRAAVKILTATDGSNEHDLFFEAAFSMHQYASIDHANVLRLYGVVTSSKPHMIITEFCQHGSLEQTLKEAKKAESKKHKGSTAVLLLSDRVKLAGDVACGMAFLANQGFVHRHLSASNCLVDHKYVAKIGGFDSAHFVEGKVLESKLGPDSYPVRWMSPQAIAMGSHSQKSDVWSFGILLWECVTFAEQPHRETPDNTEVCEKILTGKHLAKPHHCPDSLYALMRSCWRMSPQTRPDFEDLLASLAELHRSYVRSEEKYAETYRGRRPGGKSTIAQSTIATMESRDNSRNQSFRSRASTFISKTFQKVATLGRKKKKERGDITTSSTFEQTSRAKSPTKSVASSAVRARSISDVEEMMDIRRTREVADYSIADDHMEAQNEMQAKMAAQAQKQIQGDVPQEGIPVELMRGNSDLMDTFAANAGINEQLYFREGNQGIFFQAGEEHVNNPEIQLYRKMQVPHAYQPQAEQGEFWDPVDNDFMYIAVNK
eukprot:m.99545 g.99545  ORF g.99545 m.99545 type:complete len:780 (+) comp12535_c0_seq6:512-2851(+)